MELNYAKIMGGDEMVCYAEKPIIINLEKLDELVADLNMDTTSISWRNTIALSQFKNEAGQYQTIVIKRNGKIVVINKSINETIADFAAETQVIDFEMRSLARYFNYKSLIPCIAGKYQLVPICGIRNETATWIMGYHLACKEYRTDQSLVTIQMIDNVVIKFDAAKSRVQVAFQQAEKMGAFQQGMIRQWQVKHGAQTVADQWGEFNLNETAHHSTEFNLEAYELAREKYRVTEINRLINEYELKDTEITKIAGRLRATFRP